MKRFGEILLAAPGSVIAGMVILIFLAIYPASNIQTDFNLEGFYPEEDIVIKDYELLENEFGRDDNTILVGFSSDQLITPEVIKDIQDLTERFEQIKYIQSVRSIWNAEQILNINDQLTFESYFEGDDVEAMDLESIKRKMIDDPFLDGFLINPAANTTAFVLEINEDENTYPNRNKIIDSVNEITSSYSGKYQFHKSGIPYFRNQYVNLLNSEIVMYIAISSFLIIFLLWYLYRSIWGVLFPMIIVWTTLLFTVAIIHLTGGYLEIMSSTIAPILLCVGVADAIHMISKFDDARENGLDKRKSIIQMLQTLGSATFLTSITTAIGFATLLSSTVVPMQKFGAYTALGVLIAYVVTIFFLPVALIKSKKGRVFNEKSSSFYLGLNSTLNKISSLNRHHYPKVLIAGVVITLIFIAGIRTVDVNGKIFDDVNEDTELMQDSRFFEDNLAPQFPMEFLINTGEPEKVLTKEFLQRIDQFEEYLLEFDEFHRTVSLNTLVKEVHHVFEDDKNNGKTLPNTDQSIAQYVFLLEINNAEELTRLVDFDYQTARVTAFTEDTGSKRINEIRAEITEYLDKNFQDESVTVTGTTILSADLTDKIVYSLAWSIILAVIAISLIMTLLFKNVKMVIISLVPNIIPLLIVAGIMGFLNIDIKPSTAVIFTIALGIAVDDSIHYLARFRMEYLQSGNMESALYTTTIRTGRAIVITSLILIAGFGTLISSAFTSTAMMGVLVCSTIFSALIADLFILPSLFYWLKPKLSI